MAYCLAAVECEFFFVRGFLFWAPLCKFLCFSFEFPLFGQVYMRITSKRFWVSHLISIMIFGEDKDVHVDEMTPGLAESEIRSRKVCSHNGSKFMQQCCPSNQLANLPLKLRMESDFHNSHARRDSLECNFWNESIILLSLLSENVCYLLIFKKKLYVVRYHVNALKVEEKWLLLCEFGA